MLYRNVMYVPRANACAPETWPIVLEVARQILRPQLQWGCAYIGRMPYLALHALPW